MEEYDVFAAIGEEGITRLIAAFYRQVPTDPILGPMYAGRDMAAAEKRLRDFITFRFGGSQEYLETRGHPRLRMRHVPFAVDVAARDRWLELMGNALRESNFPEEVNRILWSYFTSTADAMRNREG